VQDFFNLQAGRTVKGFKEADLKRISLTSGDVLRLLKPHVEKTLRYDNRTKEWRFRRLDSIETNSVKRELTSEEMSFFDDEQNRLIVIRNIVKMEGEDARMWLNPKRVITMTKEVGEKVIKEVKNNETIYDSHRIQASVDKMDNLYLEGLRENLNQIVSKLLRTPVELDLKSLVKEKGAEDQCIHTDALGKMSTVSVLMPTFGKYKLAVYRYRGTNDLGQEVLEHYILEADVGDVIVFKSDFLHNGVRSEQDGTLLFAYGNNPHIKKSRINAGGKVNILNNRIMRNGRERFKICVKGFLYDHIIKDASYSH
jgi:hypothetical protein